jgi:hypothetical protein
MQSKTLIVLIAAAMLGSSSTAMARGGGGWGGRGGSGLALFHNHFLQGHFNNLRNQAVLGGWGWGWGTDWPSDDSGYGNSAVLAFPQASPGGVNVTGSIAPRPCNWHDQVFTVPSSAGGSRSITITACR